jgi:hypothetical protein
MRLLLSGERGEAFAGEPKRRTRWPVIEAAICCDPVNGMLDIVSKGGRPLREEIAQSFAEHLLDSETALTPVSRRDFDLDRLKRPAAFPTDPVDGVKSVKVTLLACEILPAVSTG